MKLEHSENETILNPTDTEIFEAVSSLDKAEDSFLILHDTDKVFCQAIKQDVNQ
jgi:hypothetical protein